MLELNLTRRFNAAQYFVDRNVDEGRGDKTAILFENSTYTYRELMEHVNQSANMLAGLGVVMEQRVMLLLQDSPEMIFSFYGAMKLGAVPIPTNILMKSNDFLFMLNDSRSVVLVVDARFLPEIEKIRGKARFLKQIVVVGGSDHPHFNYDDLVYPSSAEFTPADTTPDDAAFWLYSGRNPFRLMGAVHHHSHMVYCTRAYAESILNIDETDRVMSSFLFFAYGLGNGAYFPFSVGATSILFRHPPTPERVYQNLVRYRPTLFFSVPTLLGALADHKQTARDQGHELPPIDSLRAAVSSAEALSPEIYQRFKQEFGVEVLEGTGSTEICHIFFSSRFKEVRPGSTGKIVSGYDARLIDDDGNPVQPGNVGHLMIRGGSIASAYWNQRQETKKNMQGEWLITGDRYMMDPDGFYFFRGRSDDMLRVGGKWLSPVEVESTLNRHAAVADSAVVGKPDKDNLVKPYAFVVLSPSHKPENALKEEIQAYVRERIATYKFPRWIEFIDAVPRTDRGHIQRFLLQERIESAGDL